MRQIAGAFAEYEKGRLVHELRHARERKRQEGGKCEGRKSHKELRPEVVAECKRLRRASPTTGERRGLRKISEELAVLGFLNERGKPYNNDRADAITLDAIQQRGEAWTVLDRISARDCRIVELLDYLEACPLGVGGDCRLLALIAVLVLSDVGGELVR